MAARFCRHTVVGVHRHRCAILRYFFFGEMQTMLVFFPFVLPFLSHGLHAPADVPSGDHGPEERSQGGELRARDAGTSLSHTFFKKKPDKFDLLITPLQEMQVKMTEARRRGDRMESEQVIFFLGPNYWISLLNFLISLLRVI